MKVSTAFESFMFMLVSLRISQAMGFSLLGEWVEGLIRASIVADEGKVALSYLDKWNWVY